MIPPTEQQMELEEVGTQEMVVTLNIIGEGNM